MELLTKNVAQQLKDRGFCVIFEEDLERCWPSNEIARTEREKRIRDFAESQGWNAEILEVDSDIRAIFRD